MLAHPSLEQRDDAAVGFFKRCQPTQAATACGEGEQRIVQTLHCAYPLDIESQIAGARFVRVELEEFGDIAGVFVTRVGAMVTGAVEEQA